MHFRDSNSHGGAFLLLQDAIKEYKYDLKIRDLSNHTIRNYISSLNKIQNYLSVKLGKYSLSDVNDVNIKEYIIFLKKQNIKNSSINAHIKNIKAFLTYCENEGYISSKTKVKKLKEDVNIIQTFNDDEIKRLFNCYNMSDFLNARNKCLISMLLDCGLRCNEICTLKLTDVGETSIKIYGKGRKYRIVPISPLLKKVMIKYERIRNEYTKNKLLMYDTFFISRTGKPLTNETVQRIVRDTAKRCKIRPELNTHTHTFRHSCAKTMLKNGTDIYIVSRILGHSSLNITKRYLQDIQDDDIIKLSSTTSTLMNIK